jgi:type III restriction enzyme
VKLQFDPNQQFQLDAVAAITDLFDGQPQGAPEYSVIRLDDYGGIFAGQARTELGLGNHLLLDADRLLANTRQVQTQNDIHAAVGVRMHILPMSPTHILEALWALEMDRA